MLCKHIFYEHTRTMFTGTRTLRTHTNTHIHTHKHSQKHTHTHTLLYIHSLCTHKEHLRTIVPYLIVNMHNAKSNNKITNTNIKSHTPTNTVWHRHTQFYTHYDTNKTMKHKEYDIHTHWHTHTYYNKYTHAHAYTHTHPHAHTHVFMFAKMCYYRVIQKNRTHVYGYKSGTIHYASSIF